MAAASIPSAAAMLFRLRCTTPAPTHTTKLFRCTACLVRCISSLSDTDSNPPATITTTAVTHASPVVSMPKFLGKGSSFTDFKRIKVCAGNGGDGAIAFFRGIQHPMGPPSGGNGGRGGNVYVRASRSVTSLNGVLDVYLASNGCDGGGKQMHGANGDDVELVVPVGTVVRELVMPMASSSSVAADSVDQDDTDILVDTDTPPSASHPQTLDEQQVHNDEQQMHDDFLEETDENQEEIALIKDAAKARRYEKHLELIQTHFKFRRGYVPQEDRVRMLLERIPVHQKGRRQAERQAIHIDLMCDGERHLLVRGGKGGYGNPHFVTPTIPGPGIAGRGDKAKPIVLDLELKTIADVGLVGLPNAGKSTLLKATSNAHPRIAPYPFTTLNPYVGTIDFSDYWTMTIADMPGILRGAHKNFGLGHQFLRHIERTKIIVYVVDLAGEAPWDDLDTLQSELEAFKSGMSLKPSIVAANKADVSAIARDNLDRLATRTSIPLVPISAKFDKNIVLLTSLMRQMVTKIQKDETESTSTSSPIKQ